MCALVWRDRVWKGSMVPHREWNCTNRVNERTNEEFAVQGF